MAAKAVITVMVVAVLGACALPDVPRPVRTSSFCDMARPILVDKRDKVSKQTDDAIVEHNKQGAKLCGWRVQ